MTLHVYRANGQPATRFFIELDNGRKLWTNFKPRTQLPAMCCKQKRIAANLVAHVYYDGTWFYCRPGCGCKARS